MAINNYDEALFLWEQWWNRGNKSALPYVIYPQGDLGSLDSFVRPWMPDNVTGQWDHWKPELMGAKALEYAIATDDMSYVDQWLDYMEAYASRYGHAGAGFNFLCIGYGPACLSAFVSGYTRYVEPTVWLEPESPMTYEQIADCIDNPSAAVLKYREMAFEMMKRVVERLGGKYLLSMPDFGEGLDILSCLRHNMNLLMDLYDCPESIHQMLASIGKYADAEFDRYADIITPANGGSMACVMRYLSAKPTYLTYCDFSAMIGPSTFEEYVLPVVKRHSAKFPGRTIYHLDGPGELAHVDLLCSVDDLFGIQWVEGAGNPGPLDEKWHGLYKKLLNHGKRIAIGAGSDVDLAAFFKIFPASEFTVFGIAATASEAATLVAACEKA